jgi:hypothetical protein
VVQSLLRKKSSLVLGQHAGVT